MANVDDQTVDLFFKVVQYLTIPVVTFIVAIMRLAVKELSDRFNKFDGRFDKVDDVHKDLYDRLNDTDKELNRLIGICEARNNDRQKEKR